MSVTKTCISCQEDKPLGAFGKDASRKDGLNPYCRECRNVKTRTWYKQNREHYAEAQRWRQIKHRYGVSKDEWMAKFEQQGGLCAICGFVLTSVVAEVNAKDRTATDHCHETGEFRGLLCGLCNLGIGYLRHDPALLRAAVAYLGG